MLQILHRILHALKKRGKHGLVVSHLAIPVMQVTLIISGHLRSLCHALALSSKVQLTVVIKELIKAGSGHVKPCAMP